MKQEVQKFAYSTDIINSVAVDIDVNMNIFKCANTLSGLSALLAIGVSMLMTKPTHATVK